MLNEIFDTFFFTKKFSRVVKSDQCGCHGRVISIIFLSKKTMVVVVVVAAKDRKRCHVGTNLQLFRSDMKIFKKLCFYLSDKISGKVWKRWRFLSLGGRTGVRDLSEKEREGRRDREREGGIERERKREREREREREWERRKSDII